MEACLPRRRGTKGRGLDAAEPETRARAIATPVDVAPLDVVARRREATASGRAAAIIDAVVAVVAIVAAVSSDEGARRFARPRAAKANAPSAPLARKTFCNSSGPRPTTAWGKIRRCWIRCCWPPMCDIPSLSSLGVTERHSDAHATARRPPAVRRRRLARGKLLESHTPHVSARASPRARPSVPGGPRERPRSCASHFSRELTLHRCARSL